MFKLALNAGHGKNTLGKRCMKKLDKNQTREWVLNSRICEKIETKLKQYSGISVLRLDDPTGKIDISLKKRTDAANNFGADFYLSIHHNAGVNGGIGGGLETYIYTKASKNSKEWQNTLYEALINHCGLAGNRSDGTRTKNLHECRESNMPCVLLECGFMDSKTDVPIILTEKFAEQVAEACVEVIAEKGKLKKASNSIKKNKVLEFQKAAVKDGFKFKGKVDGVWDANCILVASKAICKKQLTYKYKNLTKLIQKAVGVAVDGKFGSDTVKAVKVYQKRKGLTADGIVGLKTWKKILDV